jgi:hypothetical protein
MTELPPTGNVDCVFIAHARKWRCGASAMRPSWSAAAHVPQARSMSRRSTTLAGIAPERLFEMCHCFQSSPAMIRRMNSSNSGTVNAVSPWLGLQIMPFAINWLRVGPSEVTSLFS